ncbi:hypothetical protein ACIBHY_54380 [Nonomuraea sp. NPDC050547]|uniref:hypothetical protein n=1 Tax=Nonomuraea sp. NPDC050547 TaxID=3364368 RepID=UPI003795EFAC
MRVVQPFRRRLYVILGGMALFRRFWTWLKARKTGLILLATLLAIVVVPFEMAGNVSGVIDFLTGQKVAPEPVASSSSPTVASTPQPNSTPTRTPGARLLPITTDAKGTVDRCVTIKGVNPPRPGYALVVGVHLRLDATMLANKRTYFPSRVITEFSANDKQWYVTPDLAVGQAGNDKSSYNVFVGEMPEEQAQILRKDLEETSAHNEAEMNARGITILDTKVVTRRYSNTRVCS